jgi:hypothetical protein
LTTLIRVDDRHYEGQRQTRLAFGDVAPEKRLVVEHPEAIGIRAFVSLGVTAQLEDIVPPVVELGLVGESIDFEQAAVKATAATPPRLSRAWRLVTRAGMCSFFFIFRLYRADSGSDVARV